MHLLKRCADGSFSLTTFITGRVPPFAILSHTWDADNQEVTNQEIINGAGSSKTGYRKIEFCADRAAEDNLEYFWVDSCCIDKSNSSELTEAINSMYRWYSEAVKCYVYLADVSTSSQHSWDQSFNQSRWFKRGWTLQELLAPSLVEFYSKDGQRLGDKRTLEAQISRITGIASQALQGTPMSQFSVEERMSWAADRQTTKEEDKAYSLLGVFEVHMPLIYGEGQRNAFRRLREEIDKSSNFNESEEESFTIGRMEQFRIGDETRAIVTWAFPSDLTESHHQATIKLREAKTGDWFLEGTTFGDWKLTPGSILWLYGNAGCGKTVLCSSIIEAIGFHCNPRPACYLAYFYFSFSDRQRQSVESFLRTIIRQLLQQRRSVPDDVRDIYRKFKHARSPLNVWIDVLTSLIASEGDTFIIIDALDECPAHEGEQKLLLQTLQRLKQSQGQKIRLLVTSRRQSSIESTLSTLVTAPPLGIQTSQVDEDIRTHIQAQLQGHPNMCTWPKDIKEEVEQVLTEKSGGMFRWVACQLESLQVCRRIGEVKRTLLTLPKTLDETYERILLAIPLQYQKETISALTWLVSAKRPLTVIELAEASTIDISSTISKPFDVNERLLDPKSIVNTLSGLVSVTKANSSYGEDKIRLAHFSVEEYLVSERITNSPASDFHLSYASFARSLSGGCINYLQCPELSREFPFFNYTSMYWPAHVKDCEGSTPSWLLDIMWSFFGKQEEFRFWEDFHAADNLGITVKSHDTLRWFSPPVDSTPASHTDSSPAHVKDDEESTQRRILDGIRNLLKNKDKFRFRKKHSPKPIDDGLETGSLDEPDYFPRIHHPIDPEHIYLGPFYCACCYGLADVVERFLVMYAKRKGATRSKSVKVAGLYANELRAACYFSQEVVFLKLLDAGADHAHVGGAEGNALAATMASSTPNERIICRLLELSYRLPTWNPVTGSVMQWAVKMGNLWAVNLILEKASGFDQTFSWTIPAASNFTSYPYSDSSYPYLGSAPYQAALHGHFEILQRLVGQWGSIYEADHEGRTALYWAAFKGHGDIVKLLLNNGAKASVTINGYLWKPVTWALLRHDWAIVELLEKHMQDEQSQLTQSDSYSEETI